MTNQELLYTVQVELENEIVEEYIDVRSCGLTDKETVLWMQHLDGSQSCVPLSRIVGYRIQPVMPDSTLGE
jgi:hypothetical protein